MENAALLEVRKVRESNKRQIESGGADVQSIIQKEYCCLVCRTTHNLHKHHCFFGRANRKNSEKYGLTVYLCSRHHNGSDYGVHFNRKLDLNIKEMAQRKFEETHTREEFREIFGKSWL